jgi:hypothetical protein
MKQVKQINLIKQITLTFKTVIIQIEQITRKLLTMMTINKLNNKNFSNC